MVNILSPSGLEDPIGGEAHSRAMLSRNWVRINDQLPRIDKTNSTLDNANFNMTTSTFSRVRTGTTGFVIARIRCVSDVAVALPINTAAGSNAGVVVPAGYMPKDSIDMSPAIQSGVSRGDEVQVSLNTLGQLLLRSNTGSALTTTIGAAICWNVTYEWDGVL